MSRKPCIFLLLPLGKQGCGERISETKGDKYNSTVQPPVREVVPSDCDCIETRCKMALRIRYGVRELYDLRRFRRLEGGVPSQVTFRRQDGGAPS